MIRTSESSFVLFPEQTATVQKIKTDFSQNQRAKKTAFLALDTGSGKSRICLEVWNYLLKEKLAMTYCLIIAPKSVLINTWKKEIGDKYAAFFLTGRRKKTLLLPSLDDRGSSYNIPSTAIVLLTYEMLCNTYEFFLNERNSPGLVICDEVHNLNTATTPSQRTLVLGHFFSFISYKIALSATMIENQAKEAAILYACFEDYSGLQKLFRSELKEKELQGEYLHEIRKRLITSRSHKKDLLLKTVFVRFDDDQKKDLAVFEASKSISDDNRSLETMVRQYLLLPGAITSVPKNPELLCRNKRSSPKLDCLEMLVTGILEKRNDYKIIIFSPFIAPLKELTVRLKRYGTILSISEKQKPKKKPHFELYPLKTKAEEVSPEAEFQKEENHVFLTTFAKSAAGLNLQFANIMFFLDLCWNESTLQQAMSRIVRFGQEKSTHCFLLSYLPDENIPLSFLDQKKLDIIQRKKVITKDFFSKKNNEGYREVFFSPDSLTFSAGTYRRIIEEVTEDYD